MFTAVKIVFYKNDYTDARNAMIQILGVGNDDVIGYVPEYDVYEAMAEVVFLAAPDSAINLLKNGGVCLLKYKMVP